MDPDPRPVARRSGRCRTSSTPRQRLSACSPLQFGPFRAGSGKLDPITTKMSEQTGRRLATSSSARGRRWAPGIGNVRALSARDVRSGSLGSSQAREFAGSGGGQARGGSPPRTPPAGRPGRVVRHGWSSRRTTRPSRRTSRRSRRTTRSGIRDISSAAGPLVRRGHLGIRPGPLGPEGGGDRPHPSSTAGTRGPAIARPVTNGWRSLLRLAFTTRNWQTSPAEPSPSPAAQPNHRNHSRWTSPRGSWGA